MATCGCHACAPGSRSPGDGQRGGTACGSPKHEEAPQPHTSRTVSAAGATRAAASPAAACSSAGTARACCAAPTRRRIHSARIHSARSRTPPEEGKASSSALRTTKQMD